MARESVHIQIPNGTLMAAVSPEAFAIFTPPDTRRLIFAGRKEQVSIVVVLDHGDGSLVTLKEVWSLWKQKENEIRISATPTTTVMPPTEQAGHNIP
jgi:hypothetical protein